MGIQKSNLNKEKIKQILKQEYKINPKEITELDRGSANLFQIEAEQGKFILKEFNKDRTVETVEKEINIINFLKERKIKVPQYMKTKNGGYYTRNSERIIIVQEFINGYTLRDNEVDDYERIIESATILGKIVKELKDYKGLSEEGIIENKFSKQTIQQGIIKMQNLKTELKEDNLYKEKFEQDLNYKIKIAKELEKSFDFSIMRKLTITNTHGDYCILQLIYNDENETTVIDFERAKKLPIVWEIMRSYSYIDKAAKDGELNINTLVQYFKEFSKHVKLNEYDLKYAAYVYLVQLVTSTFGYKEYNNDYNQTELLNFAFFRTNLCKYLYENLEKIGEELSEKVVTYN